MSPANRLLIQVVPRLTPARCGVSDQAVLLARELKTAFGIDAAFVVLNSDERCDLPYPMIHCQPGSLLNACLSLGQSQPGAVLVHVSGYGYAADGAPTLLAEALAKLKMDGQFRIAAYFHELFATGMPWRSAFWHSRRQREAMRKIAEECNLLVTNLGHHARWLGGQPIRRSDTPVQLLPVFSIGGETRRSNPHSTERTGNGGLRSICKPAKGIYRAFIFERNTEWPGYQRDCGHRTGSSYSQ